MKRLGWLVLSAASVFGCHRPPAATPADVLPLRSIRLYEVGVAYFERAGVVTGEGSVLPVPASHVDDALKTLVVLGEPGRSMVSGVEFESLVSHGLARSLAALPLDADRPVNYRDLLESLRGVEVLLRHDGDEIVGTLVEVGAVAQKSGPERLALTVLERDGSVRRVFADALDAIRPTDANVAARLQSAIAALSGRAAQMPRALRIAAQSRAPIRLGYLAETPVWRASYRVLFGRSNEPAALQGWALIHNDTDESWSGIDVELVNGRPDSFLFPLSAPRYARRPLAEPAEALSTVPQLADKTPDQLWGDNVDESELGLSGIGEGGSGQGFGAGHGRLGGSHKTQSPVAASSQISIGNLAEIAQATGVEAGALFSYKLSTKLGLRAHGSALVPFTQQPVAARRITWFEPGSGQGQSATRLLNTTAQTLPAGPVALYEAGGFSGETGLPRLKPGERAFLRFGVDLDLELQSSAGKPQERAVRAEFEGDQLIEHFLETEVVHHRLKNRAGEPRLAYVVLDIVSNAKVTGADELDFDPDRNKPLAVFRVPAHGELLRELTIEQALARRQRLSQLEPEQLRRLAQAPDLPEPSRKLLGSAARLLELVAKHQHDKAAAEAEIGRIELDLKRVREHLQALGDESGTKARDNPFVARLLELENRLSAARQRADDLGQQKEQELERVRGELERL